LSLPVKTKRACALSGLQQAVAATIRAMQHVQHAAISRIVTQKITKPDEQTRLQMWLFLQQEWDFVATVTQHKTHTQAN
jgi:hypothetical protein